ncbi:MAG: hypothetical protein ACRDL4_01230 [Thermoleophilaceae bacterium]
MASQTQVPSPELEAIGTVGAGMLAGVALGWAVAAVLQWRNLRGTFALPLALVGYVVTSGELFSRR